MLSLKLVEKKVIERAERVAIHADAMTDCYISVSKK
jgi:hypothetical protein